MWYWVWLIRTQAKRHRKDWLLTSNSVNITFLRFLSWNVKLPFVLISKWKAISVFKKAWEEMQKLRPRGLVLFPLFSREGFTAEGSCATHSTTCGAIHWGQTWSAYCWLSESFSYNNTFSFVLKRRKITGTCLLRANDRNHRLYNLGNRKANAFLPAHWGNK